MRRNRRSIFFGGGRRKGAEGCDAGCLYKFNKRGHVRVAVLERHHGCEAKERERCHYCMLNRSGCLVEGGGRTRRNCGDKSGAERTEPYYSSALTALSVSTSQTTSPAAISSPACLPHDPMFPWVIVGESAVHAQQFARRASKTPEFLLIGLFYTNIAPFAFRQAKRNKVFI